MKVTDLEALVVIQVDSAQHLQALQEALVVVVVHLVVVAVHLVVVAEVVAVVEEDNFKI